jgi:hypothetical protein
MQQKKKRKLTKRKLERKKIKMVSNPVSSDKRETRKRQLRGGVGGNVNSEDYEFPLGNNTFRNAKVKATANVMAKANVNVKAANVDSSEDANSGDNNNPFNVTGRNSATHDPDAFDNKTFNRRRVIGGMVVVSLGALGALAAVVAQ